MTGMFAIGDRVQRIEDRPDRGGTVLAMEEETGQEACLIAYDEGGQGWWPVALLQPETVSVA